MADLPSSSCCQLPVKCCRNQFRIQPDKIEVAIRDFDNLQAAACDAPHQRHRVEIVAVKPNGRMDVNDRAGAIRLRPVSRHRYPQLVENRLRHWRHCRRLASHPAQYAADALEDIRGGNRELAEQKSGNLRRRQAADFSRCPSAAIPQPGPDRRQYPRRCYFQAGSAPTMRSDGNLDTFNVRYNPVEGSTVELQHLQEM